jgi:hypothetical protein
VRSIDSKLTNKEKKILTYLLNEYKQYHHFPDIEETKEALKINYTKQLEEKLILQFVQRGFPQVGMTPNQEKVFNYIVEQYSKYDTINTFNEIGRELNISRKNLEKIITKLEKRSVIHRKRDNDDKIIPPISKIGYDHQVILKDGRNIKPIEAACVIDALGLPFTYNQDATILSKDPITRKEIKIEIKDEQIASQQPKNLITYLGSQCSTTLFFISNDSLKEWEKQHPDQKGTIINIEQALTLGRKIFENRLDIDYVPSCEISIGQDQKNIEWLEIPPTDKKDDCCG